jgi:hypothetical protein
MELELPIEEPPIEIDGGDLIAIDSPLPILPIDAYTPAGDSKYMLEVDEMNPDSATMRLAQYSPQNGERVADVKTTVSRSALEEQRDYYMKELARIEELLAAFETATVSPKAS